MSTQLGVIDLTMPPQKPEVFLCLPNGTAIAKVNNRSGLGYQKYTKRNHLLKFTQLLKLGNINEIAFSIPYQIEINHQFVRNPVVDMVRERYLLKVIDGTAIEWYLIALIDDTMDQGKDMKTITAYSLAYELKSKIISNFKVTSQNINSLLLGGTTVDQYGNTVPFDGVLKDTLWNVGTVDASFSTMYRAMDISSSTALDTVLTIATTFNAVCVFDTVNREISFQPIDSIGLDRGLTIGYGKYARSIDAQYNTDEMATRYYPYGKNGLTIDSVNPTGSSYIEDFSYFMYPFQQDGSGKVLTSSYWMSDGLCQAIVSYNNLVASKKTDYTNYLNQLSSLQTTLTQQQNDLANLNTQMATIQNNIDIAQSTGTDASTYLSQQTSQQSLINQKQSDINNTQSQMTTVNNNISSLQSTLSITNNFTAGQIKERNQFIIEKEWRDDHYTDAQSLYNDAVTNFQKINTPQLIVKTDILNLKEIVLEQANWDKLTLGETITIEYDVINVDVKAKIIEIEYDHQEGNITVTIANLRDIIRDKEKILKMLNQGLSTSTTVDMSKYKWDNVDQVQSDVNNILNNAWNAAKIAIDSGVNNTVTVNNRGITITNSTNTANFVRMTNGVIGITADGGNTFKLAIDSTGVHAQQLVGQIIAGTNLTITTGAGDFLVNQNGVTIDGTRLTITNGLPLGSINFNTATNGVVISAANGIVVTRSDTMVQTTLNSTSGISIAKNTGTVGSPTWTNQFNVDSSGNLFVSGVINANDLQIKGVSVLNGNTINGAYISNINAGTINAGSLNGITMAIGSGNSIFKADTNGIYLGNAAFGSAPFSVDMNGNLHATSATISGNINTGVGSSINANYINAGQISATYINTVGLSSEKVYQAGSPNNYAVLGGSYSDLVLYYNSAEYFRIYNNFTVVEFHYKGTDFLYSSGVNTYPQGHWDFTSATTSGIVAVFG